MAYSDVVELFWRLTAWVFSAVHVSTVWLRICLICIVRGKLPQIPLLWIDLLIQLRQEQYFRVWARIIFLFLCPCIWFTSLLTLPYSPPLRVTILLEKPWRMLLFLNRKVRAFHLLFLSMLRNRLITTLLERYSNLMVLYLLDRLLCLFDAWSVYALKPDLRCLLVYLDWLALWHLDSDVVKWISSVFNKPIWLMIWWSLVWIKL